MNLQLYYNIYLKYHGILSKALTICMLCMSRCGALGWNITLRKVGNEIVGHSFTEFKFIIKEICIFGMLVIICAYKKNSCLQKKKMCVREREKLHLFYCSHHSHLSSNYTRNRIFICSRFSNILNIISSQL